MSEYITLGSRAKDITGQRFGRLVALGPVGRSTGGNIVWRCRCDCGNVTSVNGNELRLGNTRSCGCLHRERSTTHGMRGTRAYKIWSDTIQRCANPNNSRYADWGGRGITVCDEWLGDFQAFYDYVGRLPNCGESGYSLDRIDNDGDYAPGNVRWASLATQSRNTRRTVMLTHNGKTQCQADWADEVGMSKVTLHCRIHAGWSVERALTQPVRGKG